MEGTLTDLEQHVLTTAFARGRQQSRRGITQADVAAVVEWAKSVRVQASMLDNVLHGLVYIDVSSQGEVSFRLTERGIAKAMAASNGHDPLSGTEPYAPSFGAPED